MKQVIINADDLGICSPSNRAIARAHRDGVLTSASLLANGPAFEHAVDEVIRTHPGLGIGLHLCLTSGRCVSTPRHISSLVDNQGRFRHGFLSLMRLMCCPNSRLISHIRTELEAQFLRLREAGIDIDHIDGHRHIQMIPPIYQLVCDLASQFGSPAIRLSSERFSPRIRIPAGWHTFSHIRNRPKQLLLNLFARKLRDRHPIGDPLPVYGILDSGSIDTQTLERILRNLGEGTSEIFTHPGEIMTSVDQSLWAGDRQFLLSTQRQVECQALVDPAIGRVIKQEQIRLVTYRDIAAKPSVTSPTPSGCRYGDDSHTTSSVIHANRMP